MTAGQQAPRAERPAAPGTHLTVIIRTFSEDLEGEDEAEVPQEPPRGPNWPSADARDAP